MELMVMFYYIHIIDKEKSLIFMTVYYSDISVSSFTLHITQTQLPEVKMALYVNTYLAS